MTNTKQGGNKIIEYLYQEMDADEALDMAEQIAQDPVLRREVEALAEAKAGSEMAEARPSEAVIARVLAYAKGGQLPRKRGSLDKTRTH